MYRAVQLVLYRFGIGLVILGVIFTGITIYIYSHVKASIPESDFLKEYQAPEINRVYDRHFQLIQEISPIKRLNLRIDQIPRIAISAFLVAEDKNFYHHPGIDPLRIFKAIFQNILHKKQSQYLVGASTITQQVAKNFLVGSEKSFLRKFREAFATIAIENQLSKDRILELYLNQIYLGGGAYGIQAAALKHFGRSIDELNIAEVALLAALPKAPGKLSIPGNFQKLKERRNAILHGLFEQGYISQEQSLEAMLEPLEFSVPGKSEGNYGYYLTPMQDAFAKDFPKLKDTGGLEIFSCMDKKFQHAAQKALQDGLLKFDLKQKVFYRPLAKLGDDYSTDYLKKVVVYDCPDRYRKAIIDFKDGKVLAVLSDKKTYPLNLDGWTLETRLNKGDVILVSVHGQVAKIRQIPEVTGGIVVMEASSGQVLAMAGGWNYLKDSFNCATQAVRQPGSCFKTFVYLAALENGFSPNDIIEDGPITMYLNNGREVYKPKNTTGRFYGAVTIKDSLAYSYNLASINLGMKVGLQHIQNTSELFQVHNHLPKHPSVILGSKETTLLKITTPYAMIFNGGYHIKPKFFNAFTQRKTSCFNKNAGEL